MSRNVRPFWQLCFTNLYAKIFELPKLKILILDNNQIINIPKQIANLKELKILSIARNKINHLPVEIKELKNLEELNISDNAFEKFPREILALSKLKSLWISKNKFKDFPIHEIKNHLTNLQRFYCYSYKLDDTEGTDPLFLQLSNIKKEMQFHTLINNLSLYKQKKLVQL